MSHRGRGVRLALPWKTILSSVLGVSLIGAFSGAAVADDNSPNIPRFAKIDPSLFESVGTQPGFVPASLSNQPVAVVLELPGAPVAQQDADAKKRGQQLSDSDKNNIRQQLEDQQNSLHDSLANAGAQIVGQMQDAYNGIHVIVPQGNLALLAAIPGITAIHAVPSFTPDNTHGVPFIGGPQAWGTGFTGKGVKVASIDTGIDYTHADFGGPGTVAAWNNAFANSTAPADPSLFGPNAPKVKGGFDFVGDAYFGSSPDPARRVPHPDPNPLDCFGHGTHTAGTLAGFGVTSSGATFHGPYNSSTVTYGDPSGSWTVGPGVAPEADIYAYRVFGCAGDSNVVDLAINRAVRDHVDVISMSLGSPFGGTSDPTSVAAQRAFEDGITVVASAGNNGGGAYIVGSPSTDNGVLSVAAIEGVDKYPGAVLSLTNGASTSSVATIDANGAPLLSGSHTLKILGTASNISLGCQQSDYAGSAGMVVVTRRGSCARVARAIFGQKAGAAAVIMINNSAGFPPFEGDITSNPDTGEKFTVTIPFLGAQPSDTSKLVAADGGSVSMSPTQITNPVFQKAASFSSGGPRNPDSASKPDVMAPGVSVASAGMGTGFKAAVMSGTSMACPMAAGIAALVKQAHPKWKGEQIKAAIMNTANPNLNLGYNVRIAGTGVVQAQNAVNSTVLASTGDSLDSIAFSAVAGSGDYTAQKTFTLTNYGTKAATYSLSAVFNGSMQGAAVSVSPSTVTVPASNSSGDEQEEGGAGKANVTVTLSMSKAAFAALPSDDTLSGVGPGAVLTVRGDIVATPTDSISDHQKIRVPFMFVPRGLSNVDVEKTSKFTTGAGDTRTGTLPLSNTGIHSGTAGLYEWGIHKKSDQDGSAIDIRDVGIEVLKADSPNPVVPQMGISGTDVGMAFLINTYGRAANQSVSEFDVDIALNGHTKPDFVVVGVDLGRVLAAGQADGILASFVFDTKGNLIDVNIAEAPMNGSIVELPFLASDLGLSPTSHGAFTYSVAAFAGVPSGPPDFTGAATFDPFNPAVSSGDYTKLAAGATGSFTLTARDSDSVLGWLVAAVDNNSGEVQVREVRAPHGQGAEGQQGG